MTFESGRSALVIQTLANGAVRQVASFPRHNGALRILARRQQLAFALSKTGSLNLYVMDLASGQIRCVTDGRSNNTEPTVPGQPESGIYFDRAGRPQVYKVNINGGAQRIREGSQNRDADVSSDGKFYGNGQLQRWQQHIAKQDLGNGRRTSSVVHVLG